MCVPAYATDTEDNPEISDTFIYACDLFFAGKGEVYNQVGVDITNSFYNSFKDEYSAGNFSAIKDGRRAYGVSCIKTHNETHVQARRLELIKTNEEMRYHLITQNGFPYDG